MSIDTRTTGATPRSPRPESASAGSDPAGRPGRRPGRIRGLDGLRALAVVAVIAYHLYPGTLPGGFLGVDVFFVVSGFLITTLLLREVAEHGRLRLGRFWERRARRLLPALALVVVVSVPIAWWADPDLVVGIGRQVLGAATFSTNWLAITAGSSYFDATQPELFAPFWSLAIEEQFYLVWPVVLVVLLVVCRTPLVRARVAAGGALASALAMAVAFHPGDDPTRVYYGTLTHAFGLLLGASAAFAWAGRDELWPRRAWVRWVGPGALVGLAALALTMSAQSTIAYRGGIFAASLLALVAVTACTVPADGRDRPDAQDRQDRGGDARAGSGDGYVRVLEARPLVWIGERSYGLYLWHWPVILVVAAVLGDTPGTSTWWRTALVAVVATTALAWASYRWVETPVRRRGARSTFSEARAAVRRGRRPAQVAIAAAAVAVLATAAVVAFGPAQSSAQRSIEAAQRQIAAQEAAARTAAAQKEAQKKAAKEEAGALRETDADADDWTVDAEQVSAYGDSVLSAAAPTLYDHFPGITIDAKPIRKWVDAAPIIEKAADEGTLRPFVVLNFGTNGGFQFKGSTKAVERILDAIGPDRKVVVVTINGISSWVPAANEKLKAMVADRPNVTVADWNAYVHDHAGLLHTDRTHPNMAGVQKYAAVLRDVLTADG